MLFSWLPMMLALLGGIGVTMLLLSGVLQKSRQRKRDVWREVVTEMLRQGLSIEDVRQIMHRERKRYAA